MSRIVKIAAIVALALVVTALTGCGGADTEENTASANKVLCEITVREYGTISLELYPDVAPITVKNFTELAESGFYEGKIFHRIIDGFMIQGGASTEEMATIKGEFSSNGVENNLSHLVGTISMARRWGDPDSASTQFFITVGDATWLDGDYAAFGRVTDGMDVALKIASDANPIDDNGTIPESEAPVIESVVIIK